MRISFNKKKKTESDEKTEKLRGIERNNRNKIFSINVDHQKN